jgi:hypothetical protein
MAGHPLLHNSFAGMMCVALAMPIAVYADPLGIASETAMVPTAGAAPGGAARHVNDAREEGHDGGGYFDRGFKHISLGRGNASGDGHDGSGRFVHPGSSGERTDNSGTASVALQ